MSRAFLSICLASALAVAAARAAQPAWTPRQLQVIRSLSLGALGPVPPDPSNRFADRADAAALGRTLFFDKRLSANGRVSCASCHQPGRGFQDGRRLGEGIGTTDRRTMAIVGASRQTWLFWDGRKDSLWSQALGPLQSAVEHGLTRAGVVSRVLRHHRRAYESVFGRPRDVNRAFADVGKAIEAYERRLTFAPGRFDRYAAGRGMLSSDEIAGLRLFVGDAHCVDCHNGPLLSNGEFHNTGVGGELGRAAAVQTLLDDEFNCAGRFSDAKPGTCALAFLPRVTARLRGAWRPPSLRNVARNAPYMHDGSVATLRDVVRRYNRAPRARMGRSELNPLGLDERQIDQLVAFLKTLGSPIVERRP
jgi:cytochrome c peroxidase